MKVPALPLYKEVTVQLIAKLREGHWKPGELMPSEPKLAKMYGVGISTVRQALRDLEADQLVVRRQGKGTFVALHANSLHHDRFHSVVSAGGSLEVPYRKLLSARRMQPSREVAHRLRLPPSQASRQAHHFRFLSLLGAVPFMVTEVTLPASVFPKLSAKDFPDGTNLLYGIYQTAFHVNVIRIEEELTAVPAGEVHSQLLGVARGAPILKIERVAYTFDGLAVEFRESWVDTANARYYREQGGAY